MQQDNETDNVTGSLVCIVTGFPTALFFVFLSVALFISVVYQIYIFIYALI